MYKIHEKECQWCAGLMQAKYKSKTWCSPRCATAAHRHRVEHYPYLTPAEFKQLISDWLNLDIADHPNTQHPAHEFNVKAAEVFRLATTLYKEFFDAMNSLAKEAKSMGLSD